MLTPNENARSSRSGSPIILNREALLSHGNREGRALALEILETGLAEADPYAGVCRLVRRVGNKLFIGDHPEPGGHSEMDVSGFGDEVIGLDEVENVYVIGAGKAVQRQAKALEDILGDRLTAGAITAKKGEGCYLSRIEVTEGAHPVPDEESIAGARKIVALANRATEKDLVFTVFSDGASSLFPLPADEFNLDDLRALYKLAIKFGNQTIITKTMVYFSQVGCGRIMTKIQPARSVNLIMCTVPYRRWGGKVPTSQIFVPTWPSGLRRMDAAARQFQIEPWFAELPTRMREVLERRDERFEVPALADFEKMRLSYWQPVDAHQMVTAAKARAEQLGVRGEILGLWSLADCAETAHILSGIARQVALYGEPFEPPVALISTGELTVPVGDTNGIGGRNQEFAVRTAGYLAGKLGKANSAALQVGIDISADVVVASVDSDGTDGPGTQFNQNAPEDFRCQAGALADYSTFERATELGIDLPAELREHNTSLPLWRLGDSLYTGHTGTCLGDLRVVLVTRRHVGE